MLFMFLAVYQFNCTSMQQQQQRQQQQRALDAAVACSAVGAANDDDDDSRTEDAPRSHAARGSSAAAATCSSTVVAGIQPQISADPVVLPTRQPGQSALSSSQAAESDVPEAAAAVKSIFQYC